MVDFASALNVQVEDIAKPPLPPIGHYRWKITKVTLGEMSSPKGAWDTIDFALAAQEAGEDVDQTALSAVGGINQVRAQNRFMFDKGEDEESKAKAARTLYNVKRFLTEHCGLDGSGKNLRQLLDSAIGAECMGNLKNRPDPEDPNNFYSQLDRTAPIK